MIEFANNMRLKLVTTTSGVKSVSVTVIFASAYLVTFFDKFSLLRHKADNSVFVSVSTDEPHGDAKRH